MKRYALLLAVLLLVGCASRAKAPIQGDDKPPTESQVVVSEEAAVKSAKSSDARAAVEGWAKWQVRLAENVELEVDGKRERHTVWIIEATYHGGGTAAFYVDATTYPPQILRMEGQSFIPRDKAIEAALDGTTSLEAKDARFIEKFQFDHPIEGHKELAVWIVELVNKETKALASKVTVDAQTGKILFITNPPSGQ